MREKGVEVDEVNYAKSGLDEATLRSIVAAAGSVGAILNTRHATVKERGWAERPPDLATFVRAAVADPNLVRRPILIRGKKVLIGYDKTTRPSWDAL